MKSSRERNILIAVLGVAGLSLLVDRVIIGSDVTGPAESSAGVISGFDPSEVDPAQLLLTQTDDTAAIASKPVIPLAQLLREAIGDTTLKEPDQTRDAFTPSQGWHEVSHAQPGVTDNSTHNLAQAFRSSHPLEAVMVLGDNSYAVIAGQTIPIGQQVDGYKLVAVHERSATFQLGTRQFDIEIANAPESP